VPQTLRQYYALFLNFHFASLNFHSECIAELPDHLDAASWLTSAGAIKRACWEAENSPYLSSDGEVQQPIRFAIGRLIKTLTECWHAMLFAFVGKKTNRLIETFGGNRICHPKAPRQSSA
jgi:hypothetical protein